MKISSVVNQHLCNSLVVVAVVKNPVVANPPANLTAVMVRHPATRTLQAAANQCLQLPVAKNAIANPVSFINAF